MKADMVGFLSKIINWKNTKNKSSTYLSYKKKTYELYDVSAYMDKSRSFYNKQGLSFLR